MAWNMSDNRGSIAKEDSQDPQWLYLEIYSLVNEKYTT